MALTATELERIDDQARRAGLTRAAWVRGIVLRQLARIEADQPEGDVAPVVDDPVRLTERALDRALAVVPRLTDPEIAERVGVTSEVVRYHRQKRGIPAVEDRAVTQRTGWQQRLADLHHEGRTAEEIAAATGWKLASVRTRIGTGKREGWLLPPDR